MSATSSTYCPSFETGQKKKQVLGTSNDARETRKRASNSIEEIPSVGRVASATCYSHKINWSKAPGEHRSVTFTHFIDVDV